jgi:hypothetical protein
MGYSEQFDLVNYTEFAGRVGMCVAGKCCSATTGRVFKLAGPWLLTTQQRSLSCPS